MAEYVDFFATVAIMQTVVSVFGKWNMIDYLIASPNPSIIALYDVSNEILIAIAFIHELK